MQRKRMRVVDISEASYDDVKEVVAEDSREDTPPDPPQDEVVAVQPPAEPEESTANGPSKILTNLPQFATLLHTVCHATVILKMLYCF